MFFYGVIIFLYSLVAVVSWQFRGTGRPVKSAFKASLPDTFDGPVYWVHAVSVGETKAVAPIARRLKEQGGTLIVSSVTATGHAEAKRSISEADHYIYLPFDIPFVMRRLVGRVRPKLLVMSETDYWPVFMNEVKRCGGKIAVVNAKLSERTFKRRWLTCRLLRPVDFFCVQGETYAKRFRELGIGEERLSVTGNLKYDAVPTMEGSDELRKRLKLGDGPVITLGSTHDTEEKQLLAAIAPLLEKHPTLKVLIVPRHPERFDQVAAMTDGRYTKPLSGDERTICIDAMGVLNPCYHLSTIAIVAGSYTEKVGGHNILEPIWFGVPTIFGPHMYSQPDLAALLLEHKAGEQVSIEELSGRLDTLLTDGEARAKLQQSGAQLLTQIAGSVDRTWDALQKEIIST